jgi:hypothetical protein
MCLARLPHINNNARDAGKLLHDRTPFFFVLLNFLIHRKLLRPETHRKTSHKRTPRILST